MNYNEKQMTEDMGGEVGEEVKRLKSLKTIECHGICHKNISVLDIRGYPHSGGLADKYDNHWWVYVHCINQVTRCGVLGTCDYDTSWGKIK